MKGIMIEAFDKNDNEKFQKLLKKEEDEEDKSE